MLKNFVESFKDIENMDDDLFNKKLTQYLYSPSGGKYRHLFKFKNNTKLACGQTAPKPEVSPCLLYFEYL